MNGYEMDRKYFSNVSIAADSVNNKKIRNNSNELHLSSYKSPLHSNQLISIKNQSDNNS